MDDTGNRCRPLLPLLHAGLIVLATIFLAGCARPEAPQEALAEIRGQDCLGLAAGRCERVGDALILRNLTIRGDAVVGLRINNPSGHVILENLQVEGTETGLEVGPLCQSCSLSVHGADIQGTSRAVLLGFRGTVDGPVDLQNLRISSSEASGGEETTLGVVAYQQSGQVTISNSTFGYPGAMLGRAIWNRGPPFAFHAAGLEIHGFGRGLVGNFSSLQMDETNIECLYDAIFSTSYAAVALDRLHVSGCMSDVSGCQGPCGAAVTLIGPLVGNGDRVSVTRSTFTQNAWSLHVGQYRELSMTDFNFTGGTIGVTTDFLEQATLVNGTVAEQAQQGMILGVDVLDVRNVAFLHNGHGAASGNPHSGLEVRSTTGGGDSTMGPRSIHDSRFEGNVPFGLKYEDTPPLDATQNWWGAATGPSLWAPAGQPIPGFGDAVALAGLVLTEPHRTSPP